MYARNPPLPVFSEYEESKAKVIELDSPARTYLHEKTMAEQMLLPGMPSRSYKMAVLDSIHQTCGKSCHRFP